MGAGKYSPTVTSAYMKDQDWWEKNGGSSDNNYYDSDGYDQYGYNKDDKDRAGYAESDYLESGEWFYDNDSDDDFYHYPLVDAVYSDWGFQDGKPTLRSAIPKN